MDYSVEYLFVFMFGMIFMGVLLNGLMFFNEDEITGMFGGRFVRVSAEPVKEWCEVPVCNEWIESYEWVPCGFKECFQRVRECVSTHLIVRRC